VVHGIMMHVEYIKGECLCVCVPTLTVRFVCLSVFVNPPSRSGLCVCVPTLTNLCVCRCLCTPSQSGLCVCTHPHDQVCVFVYPPSRSGVNG